MTPGPTVVDSPPDAYFDVEKDGGRGYHVTWFRLIRRDQVYVCDGVIHSCSMDQLPENLTYVTYCGRNDCVMAAGLGKRLTVCRTGCAAGWWRPTKFMGNHNSAL